MELIEKDYTSLAGTLPKGEYNDLDNEVLGNLLRIFNDPALHKANGDVFGRIFTTTIRRLTSPSGSL